jgi:GSH-dependent disulfide-bond oxidoreductase
MTLQLYTAATPNGRKISIMLEELGVEYDVLRIDITKDEQFTPAFLRLNPNNKIPVLIDRTAASGASFTLFESGAILVYLAEKFASGLWPDDPLDRAIVLQWIMFQMGGVGPMFGQLHHFRRFASHDEYALHRFQKEVHRLYAVLDRRLSEVPFVGGTTYSIADIAVYPWIARFTLHEIDWITFPHIKGWYDKLSLRPAVIRGMNVPSTS